MPNNDTLLQKALDAVAALSPDQQREMMELQRQSFAENNVALSRPAPDATDKCGELVTVATQARFGPKDVWRNEVFVGERSRIVERRELVTRSQAEELLAAKDIELAEFRKGVIELVNEKCDLEFKIVDLEADNAAKDARIELLREDAGELVVAQYRISALEAKLAAAEKERLRFEGDLDKWMKIIGAGITGYQPEAYALMDLACQELVTLRAKCEVVEQALETLLKLNDDGGPFGGEIYQDRVDRAWNAARAALEAKQS